MRLPSVGQDAVNVLDKELCSTRFTVDCAVYDFFRQTNAMLHKKLKGNIVLQKVVIYCTCEKSWPDDNKHIKINNKDTTQV